jgi:hypothetical protein
MNVLRTWSPQAIAIACVFWMVAWVAILSAPYRQAGRWARETADQVGIAAVSFGLWDTLGRLAVVFLPPAAVLATWLIARRLP